ncbi:hypothetical protein [Microseira wollei]|uniref:hypothetical protein n=1 Tax=Microseira wollei TaxID=467598 RepID=UPI001CFD08C2|nr:hypothetical protein [Microseira wollei]
MPLQNLRHHTTFGYKLKVSVSRAPTKPFKTGDDTACYCNYASPIDSGIATGGNLFGVALYFTAACSRVRYSVFAWFV